MSASPSTRSRILVVEDDARTSASLELYLKHAGYEVEAVATGSEALTRAAAIAPSLVVLDLMLPGVDGLEVCRTLRRSSRVPIIMLTARSTELDKLRGLDSGADDYVTKPFSPRELVARVGAVLRRTQPARTSLRAGNVEIDLAKREVRYKGERVPVTATEFRLLEVLASTPGRAFTRGELAERAFGHDHDAMERTVDVHIMNLRRKIEPGRTRRPGIIVTVFGTGYRLRGDTDAD